MALMKKSNSSSSSAVVSSTGGDNKRRQRTLAKQQQISESIAGVSMTILENAQESVSAIEELKSSMEQIATAAEENRDQQALDQRQVSGTRHGGKLPDAAKERNEGIEAQNAEDAAG